MAFGACSMIGSGTYSLASTLNLAKQAPQERSLLASRYSAKRTGALVFVCVCLHPHSFTLSETTICGIVR